MSHDTGRWNVRLPLKEGLRRPGWCAVNTDDRDRGHPILSRVGPVFVTGDALKAIFEPVGDPETLWAV